MYHFFSHRFCFFVFKKSLPHPRPSRFFLMLFSKSVVVLHFKFSSEIYSGLTFWLKCVRPLSRFFLSFCVGFLLFQGHIQWRGCLYVAVFPFPVYQRAVDYTCVDLVLGSRFLFHHSACLLFTNSTAPSWFLEPCNKSEVTGVSPPTLLPPLLWC